MARVSPLRKLHQQAEAAMATYGPPEADIRLVETFGELELEYAALRRGCILLDQPHRATIEVTGRDRLEFLNRMVTQELKDVQPFQVRRSFWLNRKGRIDADLRIIELGSRTLLDLDAHAVQRTLAGLEAFIITEDVQLRDLTESMHRLALHGPTAAALLQAISTPLAGLPIADLTPGRAALVAIAGAEVIADRDDSTGEPGLELTLPAAAALSVYQQLIEAGQEHDGGSAGPASRFRLRPAGWHAFNIARIEAGRPLYNLDFGPDSLPHETGIIRDRVSFTKGCYLGQEVVARMESRGHSKRQLVALRLESSESRPSLAETRLPATGALVYPDASAAADPIGAVTSSTLSPMLGGEPICFAAIKPDHAAPGSSVRIAAQEPAEAAALPMIRGTVQPSLTFWTKPNSPS
jgi:folate-binding protein YgfZ